MRLNLKGIDSNFALLWNLQGPSRLGSLQKNLKILIDWSNEVADEIRYQKNAKQCTWEK